MRKSDTFYSHYVHSCSLQLPTQQFASMHKRTMLQSCSMIISLHVQDGGGNYFKHTHS